MPRERGDATQRVETRPAAAPVSGRRRRRGNDNDDAVESVLACTYGGNIEDVYGFAVAELARLGCIYI
ncbi:hypothetical protein Syun_015439 [Stephania yunnanensis]|uniref:Uncharacterized protein n=1 Tax=Stephania yunnanensis TaxID=152371 RepID=A0AAP0JLJ1_9MAGN